MEGIAGANLEVCKFDVVHDEPPGTSYDLIAIRALLHHLPERREVVHRMAHWLKPGGWLFVQEPDFCPTSTVEPPSQKRFWEQFIQRAASHHIDFYVGRRIASWLQTEGLLNINSEGHAIVYNGGSEFAKWQRSCKMKVAFQAQRYTSSLRCIVTQRTGRPRYRLSRRPHSVQKHVCKSSS